MMRSLALIALSGAVYANPIIERQNYEALFDHIAQRWDAGKIDSRISGAAEWAAEHGATIWCGEFGAYRPYANPLDRARYVRDVRSTLEHYGIGWTLWDYQGSFSLVEKSAPGAPAKVDWPMAEALDLPSIKSAPLKTD